MVYCITLAPGPGLSVWYSSTVAAPPVGMVAVVRAVAVSAAVVVVAVAVVVTSNW